MSKMRVIAIEADSGSGKTTLNEKLINALKEKGMRVAVIKHDVHNFDIDHEGKDTWRFTQAGADITIINSAEKIAYIEQRSLELDEIISMVDSVDLILVEGYKNSNLPQIGIARNKNGKGFTADISRFIAIVTDIDVETSMPCFGFDDIEEISKFIVDRIRI